MDTISRYEIHPEFPVSFSFKVDSGQTFKDPNFNNCTRIDQVMDRSNITRLQCFAMKCASKYLQSNLLFAQTVVPHSSVLRSCVLSA